MAHLQNLELGTKNGRLYKLEGNAKTQKTDKDIFVPETTRDSETKISEVEYDVIDKTNSKINSCVKSDNFPKIRGKNVLNEKYGKDLQNADKESKSAFNKISEGIIPNSIMQSDLNSGSGIDINPRQIEHENAQLTGICSELKCPSENLGIQKPKSLKNKTVLTSEQNNEDKSDKSIDSNVSKEKMKFSIDYILSIPGPSNSCDNISMSSVPEWNIEDRPLSIEQTPEERKDSSMSLACKKKATSGNIEVLEGMDLYGSCQREYRNVDEECQPSPIDSHERKYMCDVCEKVFTCFIQLEEHYSNHEGYHSTFCRICKKDFDEHLGKGKDEDKFKCCFENCGYETIKQSLKCHLYIHSTFKLFKCELCGERYRTYANLYHHSKTHPRCEICKITFVNNYSLYAHSLEH